MCEDRSGAVVFVAVGSNIEPEKNIVAALAALQEAVRVVASSTFYRTEPIGRPDQPRFINGVWWMDTSLSPVEVRQRVLRPVEARLGRRRTQDKFSPRTIDLDLVLYNDVVVNQDDLILPHPDLVRPFVYLPVIELLSQAGSGVPDELREGIMRLLPRVPQDADPGEPLPELTQQLRALLCA